MGAQKEISGRIMSLSLGSGGRLKKFLLVENSLDSKKCARCALFDS